MSTQPTRTRFSVSRFLGILLILGALSIGLPVGWSQDTAPTKDLVFTAGPPNSKEPPSIWKVRCATREAVSPPANGIDFANWAEPNLERALVSAGTLPATGEGFLADPWNPGGALGWSVPVPATLTLVFKEPFLLQRVDLKSVGPANGVSDFSMSVKRMPEGTWEEVKVLSATATYGASVEDGYVWRIEPKPVPVQQFRLVLKKGTVESPDQAGLAGLNLWGRKID